MIQKLKNKSKTGLLGNFGSLIRSKGSSKYNRTSTFYETTRGQPLGDIEQFLEEYELTAEGLGFGMTGVVQKCIRLKDDKVFAVKQQSKCAINQYDLDCYHLEAELMQGFKHRNLVSSIGFYEDSLDIYTIMHMAHGGNLDQEICSRKTLRLSEFETLLVIKQLISALDYLNKKNIVHRDLKLDQVLLEKPGDLSHILLADFGYAAQSKVENFEEDLFTTRCGSIVYQAPEVVNPSINSYSYKCDIWSLGIMTYALLCGFIPCGLSVVNLNPASWIGKQFIEGEVCDEVASHLHITLQTEGYFVFHPENIWSNISSEANLLQVDPKTRPNYTQIQASNWLKENSEDKI
eukprot:maker-scaffold_4-snap-gene-2.42-mRNA-1 protein AED:0.35 eAED:0.78 QI:0/0/0/1/1/1/2/0/347